MTVDKYLRIKQVAELTGLSRATIYNMEKAGTFPKKTPLGARAVAWRESEIAAWMESRQHVEKSVQEKRPGKPPEKKPKPVESSAMAPSAINSPKAAPPITSPKEAKADAMLSADDWSEDAQSSSDPNAGEWDVVRHRRPSKVSLPTVGALSRTSKEILIALNPQTTKCSQEIGTTKDFLPKKTDTKS